mgnify:CR=1 FL=1
MQQSLEILNSAVNDWLPEPRPVSRPIPALELEQMLDLSLGQAAENFSELKKAVKEYLYYTPDAAAPEFCKLLYSGRNEPALLGDWVTSLANATMHTYQVSPVATLMELELIRQWNRLIGFDTDTRQGDGVMVAGGSQANLISMMLARHRACPDLQNRGNDGRTLVAFVSDHSETLVELHGQHDDRGLLNPRGHRIAGKADAIRRRSGRFSGSSKNPHRPDAFAPCSDRAHRSVPAWAA